jgi:hypothetical protein
MEKIQDFKPEHEYLKNQKIRRFKNKFRNVLGFAIMAGMLGGFFAYCTHFYNEERSSLRKKVYEVADLNSNNTLEKNEIIELGKKLEKISGNFYPDSFEGVRYQIDNSPSWVYKEFLERYGGKELKGNR